MNNPNSSSGAAAGSAESSAGATPKAGMQGAFGTQARLSERPPAPVLIFDIETVPDIRLMNSSYEPELDFETSPEKDWRDLRIVEAIRTQNKVNFPPPLYHTVVSICALYVHPETYAIKDGFKKTIATPECYEDLRAGEAQLLRDFWDFSIKYRDHTRTWYDALQTDFRMNDYQRKKLKPVPVTFCGYNITGFDLPVIEQRSMRHLLTCPIPEYAQESGYDSYRSKFALDKCFDLCHFIAGNAQSRVGLDVIARSMGLAGKLSGMDGSLIAEAYFENKEWERIEEYCAVDVLITYGVLLGVQKFRGLLDTEQFKDCLRQFERFLNQDGKPSSYRALAENSREFFAASSRTDL